MEIRSFRVPLGSREVFLVRSGSGLEGAVSKAAGKFGRGEVIVDYPQSDPLAYGPFKLKPYSELVDSSKDEIKIEAKIPLDETLFLGVSVVERMHKVPDINVSLNAFDPARLFERDSDSLAQRLQRLDILPNFVGGCKSGIYSGFKVEAKPIPKTRRFGITLRHKLSVTIFPNGIIASRRQQWETLGELISELNSSEVERLSIVGGLSMIPSFGPLFENVVSNNPLYWDRFGPASAPVIGRIPVKTEPEFWEYMNRESIGNRTAILVPQGTDSNDVALYKDGKLLTIIEQRKGVELIEFSSAKELAQLLPNYDLIELSGHSNALGYLKVSPDGKVFMPYDIPKLPRHPIILLSTCFGFRRLGPKFIEKGAVAVIGNYLGHMTDGGGYSFSGMSVGDFLLSLHPNKYRPLTYHMLLGDPSVGFLRTVKGVQRGCKG